MAETRVLVAEDESLVRLDLVESLVGLGYQIVGEAADGVEAVALAKEHKPDVALMDIKMPNMDGLTAAAEIIEATDSAVVMLTAFSQRDMVEQACKIGTCAYLVKPYDENDLVPAIELAKTRAAERRELATEVKVLTEKLESRKVVDRAKGKLIDEFSMAEQDAYRFVQQTAMRSRTTMESVAQQVIEGELSPSSVA